MSLFHLVILALVQGITEFLPISSSAHLFMTHALLGSDDLTKDLTMDIAVHVGTLFAVLLYFHKDILAAATGRNKSLLRHIIIASIPVVIAGYCLHVIQPGWIRSLHVTAWFTLIFGILLWAIDRFKPTSLSLSDMTWKRALLVGLAQILALIPGTSRSGITITAARYLGFNRTDAARFSMLLALVAISGAGTLGGIDLWQSDNIMLGFDALIAAVISFFSSWAAIALLMRWLTRASFTPFAIYRIILGAALLVLIYTSVLPYGL